MPPILEAILKFFRNLLGMGETTSSADAIPSAEGSPCGLGQVEIPMDPELSQAPILSNESDVARAFPMPEGVMVASAQSVACQATIKPDLVTVIIRTGPDEGFAPLAQTGGGAIFAVNGAAERLPNGLRWYSIQVGPVSGWVRNDALTLADTCTALPFITAEDITPPAPPPPPNQRFALPTTAKITQSYKGSSHPGLDMGTAMGTEMRSVATGVVIRSIKCTKCNESKSNIFPCGDHIFRDEGWGYGYGNFVVVRYDYNVLPETLRQEMDRQNPRAKFAYWLLAHFSRLDVKRGDSVVAGTLLGLTGNHGCSTGSHLHFEVRIGNAESVDGAWLSQKAVNPNLMFVV